MISSYNIVLDRSLFSELAYTSHPYLEAMAIRPAVTYTTYATSSKEQTGDIITFTQFEEGNLLSENHDSTEKGDKFDDDSTMPPLLSEEEMDTMYYGDDSEGEPISTDMLEDIRDNSQTHPNVNRR